MSSYPPPPPPPPPGGPGAPPPWSGAPQPPYQGGPPPYQPGYQQPYQPGGQPPYGYGAGYGYVPPAYAGFWARLVAQFIDGLLAIVFYVPGIVLFIASFVAGEDVACSSTFDDEFATGTCTEPNVALLLLGVALLLAGVVAYFWFLVTRLGRTGQTPGRKAMGIKVVDRTTGQPIGVGKALGRYAFAAFVSAQVCYLGYLWVLWEKEKRTWHDMVVNSIAVRA